MVVDPTFSVERAVDVANAIAMGDAGHLTQQTLFHAMRSCSANSAPWKLVRDYIVAENMGLVYATMNRWGVSDREWDDAFSEASLALVRTVERFDPLRGVRFGTYACKAIMFELIRARKLAGRRQERFGASLENCMAEAVTVDSAVNLMAEDVRRKMEDGLTERESHILSARFGLKDGRGLTLREIGENIGVNRERVRQIQKQALGKLRRAMEVG